MKLTDRPISEVLTERERKRLYTCTVGGVSWPGKDYEGVAVLLSVGRETTYSPYCAYVTDIVKHNQLAELVRQCCVLDLRWQPDRWIADMENDAAFRVTCEINREMERGKGDAWEGFRASPPLILEDKRPYEYIKALIEDHLVEGRQRLFLKYSEVEYYLGMLDDDDLPTLKWGAYPILEATAFALMDVFKIHEDVTTRPPERRGEKTLRHPMLC